MTRKEIEDLLEMFANSAYLFISEFRPESFENLIDDCADKIEQAINEARTPQWISVKEGLPELTGVHLTLRKGYKVTIAGMTDYMLSADQMSYLWGEYDKQITHWMLLPEAPKEEK